MVSRPGAIRSELTTRASGGVGNGGCQNVAAVPSRFVLCLTILALTGASVAAPPTATAAAATPSPGQIREAVSQAERSRQLWATINICNTRHQPHTVGIRAQVQALSFSSSISIGISLDFWSPQTKRFKFDPGTKRLIHLGSLRTGVHQRGVSV